MKRYALGLVVVLAALVLGATVSAYTTATVERDVSVGIEGDLNAVVEFGQGEGTEFQDAELVFNAENENLNENALFTYGDTANPTATPSFTVTNADDATHDFTFSAVETSSTGTDLTYVLYDSGGNQIGTVTEGGSATTTLASGDTVYVVVEANTGNDAGATYEGTFTVNAN